MPHVCFVEPNSFGSSDIPGTKQRVALAVATSPGDEFLCLPVPLIDPAFMDDKNITETGHAAWVTDENGDVYRENGDVFLTFQARGLDGKWQYYVASIDESSLTTLCYTLLVEKKMEVSMV